MVQVTFPFKPAQSQNNQNGHLKIMASGILSQDMQFANEQAWHGLTTIKTSAEIATDGFPFELNKSPLFFTDKDGKQVNAGGQYLITSTDNGLPVGVEIGDGTLYGSSARKPSFGFMSNAEFIAMVNNTITNTGFEVASLFTLHNRQKRGVSLRPGKMSGFKVGSREFKNYLSILDAVDGTLELSARFNSICVVCANTLAQCLKQSDATVSNPHTKFHLGRIPAFESMIEAFYGHAKQFEKLVEASEETKMTEVDAKNFFAGFLNNGKTEELSSRRWTQAERLTELFNTGKGNKGETVADLWSAVTDFYTHEHTVNSRLGRFGQETQSEIGSGFDAKNRMMDLVTAFTPQGVPYVNKRQIANFVAIGKASFDISEAPKGLANRKSILATV